MQHDQALLRKDINPSTIRFFSRDPLGWFIAHKMFDYDSYFFDLTAREFRGNVKIKISRFEPTLEMQSIIASIFRSVSDIAHEGQRLGDLTW